MKRWLIVALLLLSVSPLAAQTGTESGGPDQFWTKPGGTASGSGVTSGATASGCTASTLVWVDSTGKIACAATAIPIANTQIQLNLGAVGTPTLAFTGATSTGFYARAATVIDVTMGGVAKVEFHPSVGFTLDSTYPVNWSSSTIGQAATVGILPVAAKQLKFTDGSTGGAVGYWMGQSKTLTESSATAFVLVGSSSGSSSGGEVRYCVEANDSTDFQSRCGILPFAFVNKAGTITCTVGTVSTATEVVAVSAGTLANTFTCADGGSGNLQILANAVSSLTQTTLRINYSVMVQGNTANTVTPN